MPSIEAVFRRWHPNLTHEVEDERLPVLGLGLEEAVRVRAKGYWLRGERERERDLGLGLGKGLGLGLRVVWARVRVRCRVRDLD